MGGVGGEEGEEEDGPVHSQNYTGREWKCLPPSRHIAQALVRVLDSVPTELNRKVRRLRSVEALYW